MVLFKEVLVDDGGDVEERVTNAQENAFGHHFHVMIK